MKKTKVRTLLFFVNTFIITIGLGIAVTAIVETYPDGIISYWMFDEGTQETVYDYVGTNDGTISGASWVFGKVGGALDFSKSDFVAIPNAPDLNPEHLTLEAWIFPTSTEYSRAVISKQPDCGYCYPWHVYTLALEGNSSEPYISIAIGGQSFYAFSDREISLNTWSHLAGTYDGSTLKIYVNGVLKNSNSNLSGRIDSSEQPVYIGKASSDVYYLGMIDEVAIYNRALTAEEIQGHYQNGLQGSGYEQLNNTIGNSF